MKKRLWILCFIPIFGKAQQTITSIQNGSAANPFVWNCTCIPSTNDNIIINHQISIDVNWAVTNGGSITVNAGGQLMQSGMRSILIDGAGSEYLNFGNSAFDAMAYTNGASGQNTGHFSITQGAYFGPGTTYTNSGLIDGLDSLMTEGTFANNGTLFTGNFLNTGAFSNTSHIAADSVGNTGNFTSTNGYMYFTAFGNTGTFTMSNAGWMDVTENWYNAGTFSLAAGLQIYAHSDFFNGDTLGGTAFLTNNGIIEVSNDFYNSHSINGGGNFCIGNESYNSGSVNGTLDFCDNTGMDFDFNVGTVAGTVTFCQPGCFVGTEEFQLPNVLFFPNPTDGLITFQSSELFSTFTVFSIEGSKVYSSNVVGNKLDLSSLKAGVYFIQLNGLTSSSLQRVLKN
jgi:hypothetical protein